MSIRRRPTFISGRRRTTALAVAVSATVVTPLALVGAAYVTDFGGQVAPTAGDATGISTGQQIVPLNSAPPAAGVHSDVAKGAEAVREITSDEPFSMIGITWPGFNPTAVAHVRPQLADGSWGQWFETESVDVAAPSEIGKGGTEPVFLGVDTTAVQVSLEGIPLADSASTSEEATTSDTPSTSAEPTVDAAPRSDASSVVPTNTVESASTSQSPPSTARPAPETSSDSPSTAPPAPVAYADIKPVADTANLVNDEVVAVLLSPDDTPTPPVDGYGDIANTEQDITGKRPAIISRRGWGADESMRCSTPQYDDELSAATVHHTAGSNNYSKAQSAGIVRGIFTYHAVNLGWCDVGYAFLVDKYGQAFEGRAGGMDKNVQGAHAGGFNANTFGISMIGDFSTLTPPDETVRRVGEIIGWRLGLAGVDPKGKDVHYSEGSSYTMYPYGAKVTLPNVFAHRDVGLTSCPGDAGYAKLGTIRNIAAEYASKSPSPGGNSTTTTKPSTSATSTTAPSSTRSPKPDSRPDSDSPSLGSSDIEQLLVTELKGLLSSGKIDLGSVDSIVTEGARLADIPVDSSKVADLVDEEDIKDLFETLSGEDGPLGELISGIQQYGDVSLVKTENGAIYQSKLTGTHAVWGAIGNTWAAQGFEHGPLGLPISEESARDDGTIAQRFENGVLVFDPATGIVSAEPTT